MDVLSGLKSIWSGQKQQAAKEKIYKFTQEKHLDRLAASMLEAIAGASTHEVEQIFHDEEAFDSGVAAFLHSLADNGIDPREQAKDFAWLKRELKIETKKEAPCLLTRVILSESRGHGASEGIVLGGNNEGLQVVIGYPSDAARPGAIVEIVFDDGTKMAGLGAIVREVQAKEYFAIVNVVPGRSGFRKRAHFRVDLKIPATLLVRSDQVAYMPDDPNSDVRVMPAELVNLSGGGGRLKLQFPVHVGDQLCIAFPLDGETNPLGAEGKVVWVKKEEGCWYAGFEFDSMEKEHLRKLIVFLFRKQTELLKRSLSKGKQS